MILTSRLPPENFLSLSKICSLSIQRPHSVSLMLRFQSSWFGFLEQPRMEEPSTLNPHSEVKVQHLISSAPLLIIFLLYSFQVTMEHHNTDNKQTKRTKNYRHDHFHSLIFMILLLRDDAASGVDGRTELNLKYQDEDDEDKGSSLSVRYWCHACMKFELYHKFLVQRTKIWWL